MRNSGNRRTQVQGNRVERNSEQGGMFSGNRGKLKTLITDRATREQRNDTKKW